MEFFLHNIQYQVYKESKDVPEHIRYACLYLSIVDKAMAKWMATQHHPLKGLGLPRLKKDFLEGNFNYRLTMDCLSVNLGGFVWK